jgi:hypothetical protein
MALNRKNFLKKVCLSGACVCGFSSIALSQSISNDDEKSEAKDKNILLLKEWIACLLVNAKVDLDKKTVQNLIKKTSDIHYKDLKMDDLLAGYKGNLEKFIVFLGEKWAWKIDYDKQKRVLIADENKNFCVCPMVDFSKDKDTSVICYCSEGFAEKMFSVVAGTPAKAEVISSIRKGDESCKYKITF